MSNPRYKRQYTRAMQHRYQRWGRPPLKLQEAEESYEQDLGLMRWLGEHLIDLIGTLDATESATEDVIESRHTVHDAPNHETIRKVEYLGTLVSEIIRGVEAELAAHGELPLQAPGC